MSDELAEIRRMYEVEMLSIPQISLAKGMTVSTTRVRLIKSGAQLRSRADGVRLRADILSKHAIGKKRVFTEQWCENISKGRRRWGAAHAKGSSVKPSGYVEFTTGPHKGRCVHRVQMEQTLGRRLTPNEVVHFKDDDRANNDPGNHELLSRSADARLHRLKEISSGIIRRRDCYGRFT